MADSSRARESSLDMAGRVVVVVVVVKVVVKVVVVDHRWGSLN